LEVTVDDRPDIVAGAHHLGVDVVLQVYRALTLQQLPVPGQQVDILGDEFVEAPARPLDPHAAAVRVPDRQVAPHHVGVAVGGEYPATDHDLLARGVRGHDDGLVRWAPTIRLT